VKPLALLIAVLLVVTGASPAAAASTDWTHYGYGPGHTSYNPAEIRITAANADSLTPLWTVRTPSGAVSCNPQGATLVAGGSVFLRVPNGIAAYSTTTGARQWYWRMGNWGPGPTDREQARFTVISGGKLLVLTHTCRRVGSAPAYVTALDLKTGALRWRRKLDVSTLTLVADRGVVAVSSLQSRAPSVTVFRVSDGKQLWHSPNWRTTSVSAGGRLMLGNRTQTGTRVVAITTGKTIWTAAKPGGAGGSNPAGNRFYLGDGSTTVAVEAATGKRIWANRMVGSFVHTNTRLYQWAEEGLAVLDAATGARLRTIAVADAQTIRSVTGAGALLYIPTHEGHDLLIVEAATGQQVGSYPGVDLGSNEPVVSAGRLFTTDGTTLTAWSPAS
jgi:outer membrane protein assembly factor BamB